jgi:hypothetical protein
MIPLTPAFLVAAATSFVGLREQGGNNRGLMIELFLREVAQPAGQPWCAAFVHHVGYWSHFDHKSNKSVWPLPATASCYVLGHYARTQGVLKDEPQAGDVFLLWSWIHGRFAHTGVVARVREDGTNPAGRRWFDCDTVEGNTNAAGEREGEGVLRRTRRFYPNPGSGDRFIRWADLDLRDAAGKANIPEPRAA